MFKKLIMFNEHSMEYFVDAVDMFVQDRRTEDHFSPENFIAMIERTSAKWGKTHKFIYTKIIPELMASFEAGDRLSRILTEENAVPLNSFFANATPELKLSFFEQLLAANPAGVLDQKSAIDLLSPASKQQLLDQAAGSKVFEEGLLEIALNYFIHIGESPYPRGSLNPFLTFNDPDSIIRHYFDHVRE